MSQETALAKKDPMGSALAAFDPKRYNMCAPVTAIDRVPDMHRISVRVVTVNPETETYPIPGQSDKVGIGKTALDKIANAGNIQWIPGQCGQVDAWNDPHRVKYRAVGVMKNFDGEQRLLSAEKVLDFRGKPGDAEDLMGADTLEIVRVAAKKGRDPWPQIAQCRQQIHSLAESKAKNRAIRSSMAIPVALPKSEIAKPFVIPALVLEPDMTDPDVKRAAIAHMFGASAALYGAGPQAVPPPIDVTPIEPAAEYVNGDGVIHEAPPAQDGPRLITPDELVDGLGPDPEPWDPPPASAPARKLPLPVSDLLSIPKDRIAWVRRLNELCQSVYDRYGAEIGRDHLAAAIPEGFDPATSPATEVAKLGAALKALA